MTFQIVILKELKHSDGNFNETQMIELNAVRYKDTQAAGGFCGAGFLLTSCLGALLVSAAPANRLLQSDKVLRHSEVGSWCVWSV